MLTCPEVIVDPLGHHAISFKWGRDAVTHHNQLRDVFQKHVLVPISVRIEMGSGLTPDHSHSCPADVLIAGW